MSHKFSLQEYNNILKIANDNRSLSNTEIIKIIKINNPEYNEETLRGFLTNIPRLREYSRVVPYYNDLDETVPDVIYKDELKMYI